MPADFEAKTGIKVRLDIYENNEEMVAKLQAGGVSQYDIIVPSDYIMPVLINQHLIQPLDHAKIPNLKNLKPIFRNTTYDPGNKYSVAYQWGTVGLMYRKDKVSGDAVKCWSVLFDAAKQPGPFWLIDSVREMMGIALLYQGYDFNSTVPKELKAAADLLVATKQTKDCMGFKPGVGGKNDVVAGTAVAAIVYNGDAIQSVTENPDVLGFTIPKEGSEIWYDSMCIPAQAPNPRCGPQMDQLDPGSQGGCGAFQLQPVRHPQCRGRAVHHAGRSSESGHLSHAGDHAETLLHQRSGQR